ncbi:helix-turn-helix domain-containing protein [Sphaerisporangium sp. NPDC049002]|uniref:ArsR/SmtB family transcription factor n=1 Tax=unclassified Sphaerisporangium TaxID=2630420 RepID=UPI0033D84851
MNEIRRRELSDAEALKALAHPLRQRLLTRLQNRGAATSAILAAEFGEDRGATSYHLRQLARYGFIEQDTARSSGLRKYWRSVPEDLRLPGRGVDAEAEVAAREVGRQWRQRAEAELAAFRADQDAYGAFGEAALTSLGGTTLTAGELAEFTEEYVALLNRWRRDPDEAPPGARHITVIFHAFPTPDPEGTA